MIQSIFPKILCVMDFDYSYPPSQLSISARSPQWLNITVVGWSAEAWGGSLLTKEPKTLSNTITCILAVLSLGRSSSIEAVQILTTLLLVVRCNMGLVMTSFRSMLQVWYPSTILYCKLTDIVIGDLRNHKSPHSTTTLCRLWCIHTHWHINEDIDMKD